MIKPEVYLFYLADARFGGWVSYTVHLHEALGFMGYQPRVMRVGKKTEHRQRCLLDEISYQNISVPDAVKLAAGERTLITALTPANCVLAEKLIRAGSGVVVHDTAEMKEPLLGVVRKTNKVISIRECNVVNLRREDVFSTYIPHPYVSACASTPLERRELNACSISRLDWDKHIDVIVEANNNMLPAEHVHIYGAENRLYTHHKLLQVNPLWRVNYKGRYPATFRAGWEIASRYRWVVDMSAISRDGQGTQYTFLEAWDAGTPLIVSRLWVGDGSGALKEGVNAMAAGNAEELVAVLRMEGERAEDLRESLRENGYGMLERHKADVVVYAFEHVLGWS